VAEDCTHGGVYEFMFVSPPLNVIGGTVSPVNRQAIR
jgi:hypothetical protein